jgi:hypothetical protein
MERAQEEVTTTATKEQYMSVVGQKTLKTRGVKTARFVERVVPAGEYEVKLLSDKASIKTGKSDDSRPRIATMFELLGTESESSGKTLKVFHDFYTSLKPGKDGKTMVERGSGAIAFARANGEELEDANIPILDYSGVECLSTKHLLQWVKNRDGVVVKARVKQEKQQDGSMRNRIDYFIEGEPAAEPETDAEEDANGETDAELVEEEDLPPPPPKKGKR